MYSVVFPTLRISRRHCCCRSTRVLKDDLSKNDQNLSSSRHIIGLMRNLATFVYVRMRQITIFRYRGTSKMNFIAEKSKISVTVLIKIFILEKKNNLIR